MSAKPSKYRNVKTVIDGFKFDSKAEARRYGELKLLERAGEIKEIELQPKFLLIPAQKRDDGTTERAVYYIADFVYWTCKKAINRRVVEDVKGEATPAYILKRKMMLEKHWITVKEVRYK